MNGMVNAVAPIDGGGGERGSRRPMQVQTDGRKIRPFKAVVVALAGIAVCLGLGSVFALSRLHTECGRAEAEVRQDLRAITVLQMQHLAETNAFGSLERIGFAPAPWTRYRFSLGHSPDGFVARAVRDGGPLAGDTWEMDSGGTVRHVVNRCAVQALPQGVLAIWLEIVGMADPHRRELPSWREAQRDRELFIHFQAFESERSCCTNFWPKPDAECLAAVQGLVELQTRPYEKDPGVVFAFSVCPAALVLALTGDPESLKEPFGAIGLVLRSPDPARQAAAARAFRAMARKDYMGVYTPERALHVVTPALGSTDLAIFGPAVTGLAQLDSSMRGELEGCSRSKFLCRPVRIDVARRTLREIEALRPRIKATAPERMGPLAACVGDRRCEHRDGAVWALGEVGPAALSAVDPLIRLLHEDGDDAVRVSIVRGLVVEALVKIAANDPDVVADKLERGLATTRNRDVRARTLLALGQLPPRRQWACQVLAETIKDSSQEQDLVNRYLAALQTLGQTCADVVDRLAMGLSDPSRDVRADVASAVAFLGPRARLALVDALLVEQDGYVKNTIEHLLRPRPRDIGLEAP